MRRIKWFFGIIISLMVIAFLHYALPSRDIVQIVGTDVKRMDVGHNSWFWASPDAGTATETTRDVRFINAAWPNGAPSVYRNEDTNWSWPPYLKFDSGNLNAEAQARAKQDGVWVAVTHYGWRIKLLSMFPNAIRIRQVDGPHVTLIPWFNIAFLTVIFIIFAAIYFRIRKFKRRRVDPVLEDVGEAWDNVEDTAAEARDTAIGFGERINALLRRWFGRG